jgi:hypothetical protein
MRRLLVGLQRSLLTCNRSICVRSPMYEPGRRRRRPYDWREKTGLVLWPREGASAFGAFWYAAGTGPVSGLRGHSQRPATTSGSLSPTLTKMADEPGAMWACTTSPGTGGWRRELGRRSRALRPERRRRGGVG